MALSKIQLSSSTGRRNLVINGAMQVAQRATSSSGVTSGGYHVCDRWSVSNTSQGTWTISQSSTTPTGFANSLKFDCTTADGTTNASDQLGVDTRIEAKDLVRLNYGTSSAQTITVSFHVRSNKTGTYTFEAYAQDPNRGFSKTYTIDSADTWEKKVITIPGDTAASQNFDDNAEIGIIFKWWLAAGSTFTGGTYADNVWRANVNANRISSSNVNLADSTSNEWYITGVQVEIGSAATEFEHRSFGEELSLCHRYYQEHNYDTHGRYIANGGASSASQSKYIYQYYGGTMRATPSITTPSVSNGYRFIGHGQDHSHSTIPNIDNPGANSVQFGNNQNTITAGRQMRLLISVSAAKIKMDAEL